MLRVLGALAFVADAWAVFTLIQFLGTMSEQRQKMPTTGSNTVDGAVVFIQLVEILSLATAGVFLFWLAAVGDSLRQIEQNTR